MNTKKIIKCLLLIFFVALNFFAYEISFVSAAVANMGNPDCAAAGGICTQMVGVTCETRSRLGDGYENMVTSNLSCGGILTCCMPKPTQEPCPLGQGRSSTTGNCEVLRDNWQNQPDYSNDGPAPNSSCSSDSDCVEARGLGYKCDSNVCVPASMVTTPDRNGPPNGGVNSTSSCGNGFTKVGGVCFPTSSQTGLSDASVEGILTNILSWLMLLFTILAIVAFVVSGIQYLLSSADEDMAKSAKKNATNAVIGIIIGLSGYIIIQAIQKALTGADYFF